MNYPDLLIALGPPCSAFHSLYVNQTKDNFFQMQNLEINNINGLLLQFLQIIPGLDIHLKSNCSFRVVII